ncbi:hypothetical protein CE91St36_12440 [Christensenellaceae bacterium]|nr:hypothetical protein CE91St36_12440 [Christensenellaceae bacterium]BDF61095.1 hypothetical protein CE91St37_12450 [Christensenellaceae bacterium]
MSEADNEKLEQEQAAVKEPEVESAPEAADDSPKSETEVVVSEEDTDVESADEEEEEEELPVITHVSKFSQKTINIIQAILGLAASAAIWLCITFGSTSDNVLLQYLFVIVFAAVMLIQRAVERKLGLATRTFVKFWLIGLIIFLAVFIIYGVATGKFTS